MRRLAVMALLLAGAAAWPAASMVTGILDFPQTGSADGVATGGADLPIILVQSNEGGNDSYSRPTGSDTKVIPPGTPPDAIGITPAVTATIVLALSRGAAFCKRLNDQTLLIDCLSDQYAFVASTIPFDSGYSGVRNALLDASAKLHQLAVDHQGGAKVQASKGGLSSHRKLIPVKNAVKHNLEAAKIIEETSTVLLRSSSGSDQRRIAYEQVAAVVDSNKVLLRSA